MAQPKKLTVWQKFGMFFYNKKLLTIFIWLAVMTLGVLSYTRFMRREGFPSVNVPVGIVQVVSFNNSADQVDKNFVQPIVKQLGSDSTVKKIATSASNQGASVQISFKDDTDVQSQLDRLKNKVDGSLPKTGQVTYIKLNASKLTADGDDLLISIHGPGLSASDLDAAAAKAAPILKSKIPLAERVKPMLLSEPTTNTSGQAGSVQVRFDRFRDNSTGDFQPSAIVAVKGVKDVDQLKLYDQVQTALDSGALKNIGASASISADFASGIREQISGLQENLLEGLAVVLIVSFILISLRGSVITALAMTTTVTTTVGVLYLIGYTLNTITLFSLVLCLALIVDDTTIIVEAIDAGLKRGGKLTAVVQESFRKVARASATGTAVTILAFAPMLFIGGILGKFIRAIPVTIITSLIVSLFVSFIFIPLMMYLAHSRDSKRKKAEFHPLGGVEQAMGNGIANAMIWSSKSRKRSISMRVGAVVLSFIGILLGGFIFTKVEFNIFPSPKDGNDIILSGAVIDREHAQIQSTEAMTDQALGVVESVVGTNLERVTLTSQGGPANRDGFTAAIQLKSYKQRDITSVELAKRLTDQLQEVPGLRLTAEASGVGPPAGGFAVQLAATNPAKTYVLAKDVKAFLENDSLTRPNGSHARLKNVTITPSNLITRSGNQRIVTVNADFYDKDTSTLVTLAQKSVENKFNSQQLTSKYGLPKDAVKFDFGQEDENQDSFNSMGKAAGPLFLAIFIIMALLFRSILQPILILSALPFAFIGVATGLYLTDNPISFFSMLGVFALIGISLNNTILLTDYANQAQKDGKKPVEAMALAIRERLRPLLTTSITSVFALLPLALHDPFWEGLAFALIFGLISSTILVLIVFPYYYLIIESISASFSRLGRRIVRIFKRA